MEDTQIFSLAKALGAKNLTNNAFSSNPIVQNYLNQKNRAQSAEEHLQATKTPLGALSSGIALYMQRKQENKTLGELNEQMKAQEAQQAERRNTLVTSFPEAERVGANALDYETLAKIQADRLKGLTPEDKLDLDNKRLQNIKLQKEINKVGVSTADSEKPPAGYRFTQSGDLEAIAGGPAVKQGAEAAGKIALVKQGLSDVSSFETQLKNKDGSFNRAKIAGMRTYGRPNARDEYSKLYNTLNARLRLESGAAVPENEVKRAFETFAPSPLDSDATIDSKIKRTKDFFQSAQEEIGQGRGAEPVKTTQNTFQSSNGVKFTIKR